jgi:hypothetical protein
MAFDKGHALVVGVGMYLNLSQNNVPIAASDARAVAETLQDTRICGYPGAQVKVLVNEFATKDDVLAGLDELAARAQEDDTVFIFYCGHGANGTDGKYYLVSHDAQYQKGVLPGTGVSAEDLIGKLRAIKAKRVFLALNTCYSGNVSPSLALEEEELASSTPPGDATAAILATGSGRVIITAAREDQRSYIGHGAHSYFTQALIDGLKGKGVVNKGGFISAFGLYEYIYETVNEVVQDEMHVTQEPELTVLKGIGPFPVALYKGATSLGDFDGSEAAPELPAVRQIKPEKAERLLGNFISTSVVRKVNTGGGAYIEGNVTVSGGDFVGRDKISKTVQGDEIHVGDITNASGIAIGRGAQAQVSQGISGEDLARLFSPLYAAMQSAPPEKMGQAAGAIQALQQESSKGKQADDTKIAGLITQLAGLAPSMVSAVTAVFGSPALAAITGPVTKFVLDQVLGKK